ncbi:MAG: serine hydrolase, partial [Acidobacteria bacterium]|nr:serine hydrolase [Acidobacteriota bacterium]
MAKVRYLLSVALTVATTALGSQTARISQDWPKATPQSVGLDSATLGALDQDFENAKYPYVDSMLVIRCAKNAYQRHYSHDYAKIYYQEAHERGPLNARLTGIYNYFDPHYHPYYEGSDAHTMQSVTKSITSALIGIATYRGEFHASLDTRVISFFNATEIKNLDDRKRHITLKDLLTMQSGFDWDEDLPYNDPHNGSSAMEASDDWIKF